MGRGAILLLLGLLLAPAASPARGPDLEPAPAAETIAAVRRNYAEAGFIVLQHHKLLDLRYDPKFLGLVGEVHEVRDFLVLESEDLEGAASLWGMEGQRRSLKDVRVEVHSGSQVTRYKKSDLRWFRQTDQHGGVIYLDTHLMYAGIPGLKAGDRVRIVIRNEVRGEYGLGRYLLGSASSPVVSGRLELRLPQDQELVWKMRGSDASLEKVAHSTEVDGSFVRHRWSLENDPAQLPETCHDYYPFAELILHVVAEGRPSLAAGANWAAMGAAYLAEIAPVFAAGPELTAYTRQLVAGLTDPREKTRRIYADVQRRCRYLGLFEGRGNIVPTPADEVHNLGFGDCKGLGTLLIAMLRVAGVDAHPVLVLADDRDTLEESVPDLAQFNHFIAWADVGDSGWFLDGTVDDMPAGRVPQMDRRSAVLLLRPGFIRLVRIPAEAGASRWTRITATGELNTEGRLRLDLEYALNGEARGSLKARSSSGTEARRDLFFQEYLSPSGHPMTLGKVDIRGLDADTGSVVVAGELMSNAPLPMVDGEIFLPLQLWDRGPYALGEEECGREVFVADRYARQEAWSLRLPAGWQLAESVEKDLAEGGLVWTSRIWQEGDTLRLERAFHYAVDTLDAAGAQAHDKLVRRIKRLNKGYLVLQSR